MNNIFSIIILSIYEELRYHITHSDPKYFWIYVRKLSILLIIMGAFKKSSKVFTLLIKVRKYEN